MYNNNTAASTVPFFGATHTRSFKPEGRKTANHSSSHCWWDYFWRLLKHVVFHFCSLTTGTIFSCKQQILFLLYMFIIRFFFTLICESFIGLFFHCVHSGAVWWDPLHPPQLDCILEVYAEHFRPADRLSLQPRINGEPRDTHQCADFSASRRRRHQHAVSASLHLVRSKAGEEKLEITLLHFNRRGLRLFPLFL